MTSELVTVQLTCEQCSAVISRSGDSGRFPRFCSRACVLRRDRERRHARRCHVSLSCEQCGAAIPATRRVDSRYCGPKCMTKARSSRAGRVTVLPAPERFWARVDRSAPRGCWEWTGSILASGYGSFRVDNKAVVTHRFAWELTTGRPIAAGLQVDHLCRNRACVNPAHLEPVTQAENLRRARELTADEHFALAALLTGSRPVAAWSPVLPEGKQAEK